MKKLHIVISLLFVAMLGIVAMESVAIITSSYIFFVCLNDEDGAMFLNIASLLAVVHVSIFLIVTVYSVALDIINRKRKKKGELELI